MGQVNVNTPRDGSDSAAAAGMGTGMVLMLETARAMDAELG